MHKLLIVEDDQDVAANVAEYLEAEGYLLDFAYDGVTALNLATEAAYDLIVLDLTLPRLDGTEVGRKLRAAGNEAPILVLTARDRLRDKSVAFEAGVDDYLVKPFELEELHMRIKALLRRQLAQGRSSQLQVADLFFDTGTLLVERSGQPLKLNRTQQQLLAVLMRESPNVVSKETLATRLWGDATVGGDALRTHIFELRTVVDKPFPEPLIHTVHSQGYALRVRKP